MGNSNIASIYEQIAKEKANDNQIKDLSNIIDKLELQDSDAFIDILVCLEYYKKLYTEIPEKIDTATKNAVQHATKIAQQDISQQMVKMQGQLAKNLQNTVIKSIQTKNTNAIIKWIVIGIILCGIMLAIMLRSGYKEGYDAGHAKGFAEARNEELVLKQYDKFIEKYKEYILKNRDFIEDTQIMENSAQMYRWGTLQKILQCKVQGWRIEEDKKQKIKWCYTSKDAKPYPIPWQ